MSNTKAAQRRRRKNRKNRQHVKSAARLVAQANQSIETLDEFVAQMISAAPIESPAPLKRETRRRWRFLDRLKSLF